MNLLDRIAYDSGGYTVQEILSSFCKKILEIIDLVNKNEEICDETRTIIENIRNEVVPDLVEDIMKELQDNGYFDSLVNVTLIEQLRTELTTLLNQTITDYTTKLDNFDTQLEHMVINPLYPPNGLNACKIDGTTDDSDNFQSLINYLHTNGGGEITLPRGTMIINKEIELKSNIIISGQGIKSKITTTVGQSLNGLNLLKAYEQSNIVIKNIQVKNLGFGKSGVWEPKGSFDGVGACILAVGCDNFIVDSCYVLQGGGENNGEGVGNIYFSCCTNSRISNNFVKYCDNGIVVDTWYNKLTGKENFLNNGIIISGNSINHGMGRGIVIENVNSIAKKKGGITVTNNTIKNMAYGGIQGNSTYNCTITGNVIEGDGSDSIYVTNKNTMYGIEFLNNTMECTIVGNTIKNCKTSLIRAFECQDLIINSNNLINCDGDGIFLKNVNFDMLNVKVDNNNINNVLNGITMKKDSIDTAINLVNNSCSNNTIKFSNDTGGFGIIFDYHQFSNCNNNILSPIKTFSNSKGISSTSSLRCNFNNNIVKTTVIGIGLYGDNSSRVDSNIIENCTYGMALDTCVKTNINSTFRGTPTALSIVNGATSQGNKCRCFNSFFDGVKVIKDNTGVLIKSVTDVVPSSGVWETGDRLINFVPSIGSYSEWIYYTSEWKGINQLT